MSHFKRLREIAFIDGEKYETKQMWKSETALKQKEMTKQDLKNEQVENGENIQRWVAKKTAQGKHH